MNYFIIIKFIYYLLEELFLFIFIIFFIVILKINYIYRGVSPGAGRRFENLQSKYINTT